MQHNKGRRTAPTAPALSKHPIKKYGERIGHQTCAAKYQKLQLTDAGKRFQYRAAQIIELMAVTSRELEAYETGLQGTLTIGTIATSAATLLTRSVQLFHQKYPDVRFEIKNMSSGKILESLKIRTIELGIIRTPLNSEYYDSFTLTAQPMIAACHTRFCPNNGKIKLGEIANKPLLINYRYEPVITEACRAAGFEPNILCKADDTRSILLWSNMSMGIAVIPKDWLNLVPGLQLFCNEIDEPALMTSSAVVWLKNQTLSSIARNFIDIFKDVETIS